MVDFIIFPIAIGMYFFMKYSCLYVLHNTYENTDNFIIDDHLISNYEDDINQINNINEINQNNNINHVDLPPSYDYLERLPNYNDIN